jgi:hypothetical protein
MSLDDRRRIRRRRVKHETLSDDDVDFRCDECGTSDDGRLGWKLSLDSLDDEHALIWFCPVCDPPAFGDG